MYFRQTGIFALAGLASQSTASPHPRGANSQTHNARAITYQHNTTRSNAVKQTFQISWDGYYKYAFPHDSLLPQTNGYDDDR